MSVYYRPPYTPRLYSETGVCRGIPIFLFLFFFFFFFFVVVVFLLQNVDCGYSLEPPRRGGFKM